MGDIFRWFGFIGRLNSRAMAADAPPVLLTRRVSPVFLPALLMAFMLAGFAAGAVVVWVVVGGNQGPAAGTGLARQSPPSPEIGGFPVPSSGEFSNYPGQPRWDQTGEPGGYQQIGREEVWGGSSPGWGQEGQLSDADQAAIAKNLEDILDALEGLVSAQGEQDSLLDQHVTDLDQLMLLLNTFQADPPTTTYGDHP